jgi:hypothetical protein
MKKSNIKDMKKSNTKDVENLKGLSLQISEESKSSFDAIKNQFGMTQNEAFEMMIERFAIGMDAETISLLNEASKDSSLGKAEIIKNGVESYANRIIKAKQNDSTTGKDGKVLAFSAVDRLGEWLETWKAEKGQRFILTKSLCGKSKKEGGSGSNRDAITRFFELESTKEYIQKACDKFDVENNTSAISKHNTKTGHSANN